MLFIQLRNKILILNLLLTSAVMIIAFSAIYFITNNSIQSENMRKLEALPEENFPGMVSETSNAASSDAVAVDVEEKRLSTDYSLSFTIKVDQNGNVLNIDSLIDMPQEAYYHAAKTAWENKADQGTLEINNKTWQYAVTPATSTRVLIENGTQTIIRSQDGNDQISFLDVTDSLSTLRTLALTFIIVGVAMLAIIFLISLFFANRSIKPISEAWEKQRQFVADASHELKTPLSIINANYDVLFANKNETIISQIKWFEYMKVGTDRMANLINSLLSLAKFENINAEVNRVPFNISVKIFEIMQSMEAAAHEKGIALSQLIEPDIIVDNDIEMVILVFSILYDNALKYTEENGNIDVSLNEANRIVTCTVKNSGKGITSQDLTKIFDRFYRADQSRTGESGGYGLGLSIARVCIDKLGGKITASSVENEITTFSFTLPSST